MQNKATITLPKFPKLNSINANFLSLDFFSSFFFISILSKKKYPSIFHLYLSMLCYSYLGSIRFDSVEFFFLFCFACMFFHTDSSTFPRIDTSAVVVPHMRWYIAYFSIWIVEMWIRGCVPSYMRTQERDIYRDIRTIYTQKKNKQHKNRIETDTENWKKKKEKSIDISIDCLDEGKIINCSRFHSFNFQQQNIS